MIALAIGAHADDIEIGASALVVALLTAGHDVWLLVLTDDDQAATRRAEAVAGAVALGISEERVLFAGRPDGDLRADRTTITYVREIVAQEKIRPDIVITHSASDSHTDHVEAQRIAHGAFRRAVVLEYAIHVSWEREGFQPIHFVDVAGERLLRKERALNAHASQQARVARADLAAFERGWGTGRRREAFAVWVQAMADSSALDVVSSLNESAFHRLWYALLGTARLTVYYSSGAPAGVIDEENRGRDALRMAFLDSWWPGFPFREMSSAEYQTGESARLDGSVLLVGADSFNAVVREHPQLRIDVPNNGAIIRKLRRPAPQDGWIIHVTGATSVLVRYGLEFLANPEMAPDEAAALMDPEESLVVVTPGSQ